MHDSGQVIAIHDQIALQKLYLLVLVECDNCQVDHVCQEWQWQQESRPVDVYRLNSWLDVRKECRADLNHLENYFDNFRYHVIVDRKLDQMLLQNHS